MAESSTPVYETETVIRNEYDFRRDILKALDNEFPSPSDAKDTELFRKRLLSALNQDFDQDDIKQTDRFRGKLVEDISEFAGGGGGSIGSATVIVKNNYRNYATVYFIEVNADGQLRAVSNSMTSGLTTTFNRVAVLGDKILFKTETGRTMIVASGSAQMKSSTEAIINGDCSLTITA